MPTKISGRARDSRTPTSARTSSSAPDDQNAQSERLPMVRLAAARKAVTNSAQARPWRIHAAFTRPTAPASTATARSKVGYNSKGGRLV